MNKHQVLTKSIRLLLLLLFVTFGAATIADAQDAQNELSLVEEHARVPIDPATKSGSTLLQLKRNRGNAQDPVSLVVGELKSEITGQLLRSKVTFSLQPEVPNRALTIEVGKVVVLKMDVSNVTEAGESTAIIFHDGKKLGDLTVINDRPPFGVKVSSATPDKPELSLERGTRTSLILKNDDPVSYPVTWRLLVKGENYEGKQELVLPAGESMPVEIDPPAKWFDHWFDGIFKPDDQDGVLTIMFARVGDSSRLWPAKSTPVKMHLNYWPAWMRQGFGNVIILLVLVAGGIASLLVNAYLPNRLRSIAAEERLNSLAGRISGISTKIDSRLRVLIRVERLRVKSLLKSRDPFSPDFADALTQSNDGIAALTSRVEAAEQLDLERHRFDAHRTQLPPTRLSRIDDDLQRAADLIRKGRPSAAEIDLAKTQIAKAGELLLKTIDIVTGEEKDDEFAKSLAARVTQMQEDFKPYMSTEVYKRFQSHIPGPFLWLSETAPDPTKRSPRDYTAIDTDLAKLAVILDYVRLHEARSKTLQDKLQDEIGSAGETIEGPETRIKKLLIPISWECLRLAQLLVRQVQCGIFEKELRDQLPDGVFIELDRQVVREGEPIEFSVRFHHPVFDRTAAREEWSYAWDFGDGLEERGWSAWHYFPSASQRKVNVRFVDAVGQPIPDKDKQVMIPKEVVVKPQETSRLGNRTKVEAARLAIGLLVAVVALAAGAKEQLLKLDVLPGLLAVFIIGFAADTIKNLVTQAPAKQ